LHFARYLELPLNIPVDSWNFNPHRDRSCRGAVIGKRVVHIQHHRLVLNFIFVQSSGVPITQVSRYRWGNPAGNDDQLESFFHFRLGRQESEMRLGEPESVERVGGIFGRTSPARCSIDRGKDPELPVVVYSFIDPQIGF